MLLCRVVSFIYFQENSSTAQAHSRSFLLPPRPQEKNYLGCKPLYSHKPTFYSTAVTVRLRYYIANPQVVRLPQLHHIIYLELSTLKRCHRCPYIWLCVWDSWDIWWVKFGVPALWESEKFPPLPLCSPAIWKCLYFFWWNHSVLH